MSPLRPRTGNTVDDTTKIDRTLTRICGEVLYGRMVYGVFVNLSQHCEEYPDVTSVHPLFWRLSRESFFDSALIRLCRVYDKGREPNGLHNVLSSIKKHPETFDERFFRERLAHSPDLEELLKNIARPDANQLEDDLLFVTNDSRVKKLLDWRGSYLAHTEARVIEEALPFTEDLAPNHTDILFLIDKALEITNRYFKLFMGFDLAFSSTPGVPIEGLFKAFKERSHAS